MKPYRYFGIVLFIVGLIAMFWGEHFPCCGEPTTSYWILCILGLLIGVVLILSGTKPKNPEIPKEKEE